MAVDAGRVKSLFLAASDLSDLQERSAFLDRECGGDAELRERVEALLRADEDSPLPAFSETVEFGTGAAGNDATASYTSEPDAATDWLVAPADRDRQIEPAVIAGRYTLEQKIGEGGMGEVWVARQTEPVKRQVALKLIKGGVDSQEVLARFDAERQALALMDHPGIARIYDGGVTPSGEPFFVMELVQGVPITDYCDQKRLSVKSRLELFVSVCQAVQHAHQKGIIHRDLKPGNVLVTEVDGRPTPKVIDFGVAKATEVKLTDMSYADAGAIVGTPAYMSPEQADPSSMDIDTRTDVYALGVMLYELLAGSPPNDSRQFQRGAVLEMLRMVREVDPPRPSTRLSTDETRPNIAANRGIEPSKLVNLLRGELDWVVMKALEKDRTRRYETANGLGQDIQRYLADEVVEARPPSKSYRLKKFVRRNMGQVIAASLVLLALIGGVIGTSIGMVRAEDAQRDEAEQRAEAERARDGEKAERTKAEGLAERNGQLAVSEAEAKNQALAKGRELAARLAISNKLLAKTALVSHDVVLADEWLQKVPDEHRGWDWRYLKQQARGGIFTISGHYDGKRQGLVTSVAYSPDGTRIATAGGRVVKVWDAQTGTLQFGFKLLLDPRKFYYGLPIRQVAFSPDGTRLVTGGGQAPAMVWDAKTGKRLLDLKEPNSMSVAFSPDGTRIATRSYNGTLKVWDARTGKLLLTKGTHDRMQGRVVRVTFNSDGTQLATGAGTIIDTKTGNVLREFHGHVAFSPDGTRLVTGDGRVIDPKTGNVLLELQQVDVKPVAGERQFAFSPDGTRVVSMDVTNVGNLTPGEGVVKIWDVRTGGVLLELIGHSNMVMSASFSPDGTRIVTGSADGTVKVWDARTATPRLALNGDTGAARSVAFSRDGTRIATSAQSSVKVWDARTRMALLELKGSKGSMTCAAFSPAGSRIVAGGKVWDARTGAVRCELAGLEHAVNSVAFSPDGTQIVTGSEDARAGVWDARTGKLQRRLTGHSGHVTSVAFSPDGTRIVTGISAQRRSLFTNDGRLGIGGGEAQVWDARTGTVLFTLKRNVRIQSALFRGNRMANLPVRCVAFSPDGTRIVTGHEELGGTKGEANVWDARTGQHKLSLKGHSRHVTSVAFSPDGSRIVTGSWDKTVRLWDARTGTALVELKGDAGVIGSVAFSPDGRWIVVADGRVVIRDAGTGGELPDENEIAYRRLHTQPNVWQYRASFRAALVDGNDFAAGFYRGLILKHAPKSEGTKLVAAIEMSALAARIAKVRKPEERLPLLDKFLKARMTVLGRDDPAILETMSQLGATYQQLKQPRKAVPLFEHVLKVRQQKPEGEGPATFAAMRQLNGAYSEAGQLDKARPLFEQIRKSLETRLGRIHPQTLAEVWKQGVRYRDAGHPKEAIPLLEDVLRREKTGGPGFRARLDFGWRAHSIGVLLDAHAQAGRFDKSRPLFEQQRKIVEELYGRNNPKTMEWIWKEGLSRRDAGHLNEAIPILEEALRITKGAPTPLFSARDISGKLIELLETYTRAGEHAKLDEWLANSRKLLASEARGMKFLGPNGVITRYGMTLPTILDRVGTTYLRQGQWARAEPILRECATIRLKREPEGWRTFRTQSLLGESLLGRKKYAVAEPLLLKGRAGMKQREETIPQPGKIALIESEAQLIQLYEATGRKKDAAHWRKVLAARLGKVVGPVHEVGTGLELRGRLDKQTPALVYRVKLAAGTTYVLSMDSPRYKMDPRSPRLNGLNPYLVVLDATNEILAVDDDSGGMTNAHIVFRAQQSGTFRIQTTSPRAPRGRLSPTGIGGFTLTVREQATTPKPPR